MIKKLFFVLLGTILLSCNKKDPQDQMQYLPGYWEIDKVEFSKDSARTYTINQFVDYIEFQENKGLRKKVRPNLDGTFTATNNLEEIEAKVEDDSLRLYYKTPFDSWKETVIDADAEHFSILNRSGIKYHYKKFTPYSRKNNEEKK